MRSPKCWGRGGAEMSKGGAPDMLPGVPEAGLEGGTGWRPQSQLGGEARGGEP